MEKDVIYFDSDKRAYSYEIDNPLCTMSASEWEEFNMLRLGVEFDITEEGIVDLRGSEEYLSQKAQQEAERVAMLSLTAADVERALYKAKGIDFDDVLNMVSAQPVAEGEEPSIDVKALRIELKANNFYRGNPYISQVGALLGITEAQLDEFFKTNDYTKLMGE